MVDHTPDVIRTNTITLNPENRLFTLEASLLNYKDPEQTTYYYRIEGLDKNWHAQKDRAFRFSNLPYGNHKLHIRARAADGTPSANECVLDLRVIPPFYRRLWFIFSFIAALVLLIAIVYFIRTRRLRHEKERLEQMVRERTADLQAALQKQGVLMKEIHHRVKNNLQVISALQQMQSSRTVDPFVKSALEDSQNRVLSIAFIHHNLYIHDDLKGVEMKSFIRELVSHMVSVFTAPNCNVDITEEVEPISLDIDTAVPLGLIINELLTNSFKYAFLGRTSGHISIHLSAFSNDGAFTLEYADDGPGLPEDIDPMKARSLGLRLIRQLSRQLDGEVLPTTGRGARYSLRFRNYEARNNRS
jgi:two-component sensor histidine kinase